MATAPLAQMMARKLISRLGGQSPTDAGQAGGDQGSPAGQQLSMQLSELQGADPQSMVKALTQLKGIAVSLYPRAAFSMGDVARSIAQAVKYLDNAIEAAQKGAATVQAVSPIANNAAIPNPQGQTGGMGLQDFASGGGA